MLPLSALHVAVVLSFAGAAGCVATLLHDAAMNPAEGKDSLVILLGGQPGSVLPCKGNQSTIFVAEPLIYTTRWRTLHLFST